MSEVVHDFDECLRMSHAAEDLPIWKEVYSEAFPTMVGMHNHRADGDHQRQGVDRTIVMENSKVIYIDEKVRGVSKKTGKVYDDILLEFLSDERRGTPGWVCKPLLSDYIAYAIVPLGKCYLLPVLQLQLAWDRYKDSWLRRKWLRAINKGWVTVNVALSAAELFPKIGEALRVEFRPIKGFVASDWEASNGNGVPTEVQDNLQPLPNAQFGQQDLFS